MAEGQKPAAAAKKPALSNRLMQMKFMQRGKEKTVLKEAVEEQAKTEDEAKWVAQTQQTGCVVLTEGDPPPTAHFGHMSFSSFNPELQKLQDEREAMLAAARKAGLQHLNGESVSAAEMAETFSSVQSHQTGSAQREQNSANKSRMPGSRHSESMREGRQKPHKTDSSNPKSGLKRKRKPRPK